MKIKVLADVSTSGKFKIGEEIEGILNLKGDQAVAFDSDPNSNSYWNFYAGQFFPIVEAPAPAAVQNTSSDLVSALGAKPARINIEF